MANDSEVMKEFLVSLGFQIQPASIRQFTNALKGSDTLVSKLGASVAGVAVAAEAMVTTFARQMENLYYTSRRTGASVKNLQALRFGAEQIGVSAEDATAAVKSLADALKFSPGTRVVFANLVGHGPGEDNKQNLVDLARAINKLRGPDYLKAQYAGMFGLTADQFLMFIKHIDEAEVAGEKLSEMYKRSGVDQKAASEAGVLYMNTLRQIWAQVGVTADGISIRLLPAFQWFASSVNEVLEVLPQLDLSLENVKKVYDLLMDDIMDPKRNMGTFLKNQLFSILKFGTAPIDAIVGWMAKKEGPGSIFPQGAPDSSSRSATGKLPSPASGTAPSLTDRQKLEQWADTAADAQNIPRNIFRAMIDKESSWNPNAKGDYDKHGVPLAIGLGQLHPGAAKDTGVLDRTDPQQNLQGSSAYLQMMYSKFGNWRDALAAYNQGPNGNLSLGAGYAADVLNRSGSAGNNVTMNQTNNIHVTGGANADKLASAISSDVGRKTADALRDTVGATR